jgi:hypothetical protein
MARFSSILEPWRHWQPTLRVETLALVASLYFSTTCNGLFWRSSLAGRSFSHLETRPRHAEELYE